MKLDFKEWFSESVRNAGQYTFVTSCVNWRNGNDIMDMVDSARDIGYAQFVKYVGKEQMREWEVSLGYGKWLKMADDYAVSFHRSTFRGIPCVYFDHSSIEYVFTLNGRI